MDFPNRKHPRLRDYDYSQNGCYFVTICVKNRMKLLGSIPEMKTPPPNLWDVNQTLIYLSKIGEVTDKYIRNINTEYGNITVDKYVIMPNHVHLLILINDGGMNPTAEFDASRPTLHTIVRSLKTMITKQIGRSIWQDSYYDRVIRNDSGYQEAWKYIDENLLKWQEDDLYK